MCVLFCSSLGRSAFGLPFLSRTATARRLRIAATGLSVPTNEVPLSQYTFFLLLLHTRNKKKSSSPVFPERNLLIKEEITRLNMSSKKRNIFTSLYSFCQSISYSLVRYINKSEWSFIGVFRKNSKSFDIYLNFYALKRSPA